MHRLVICLFLLLLILVNKIENADWDYGKHGPDVWKEINSTCGGQQQSPINIRTACTVHRDFDPFMFTSVHYEQIRFKLTNNGHTIVGEPNSPTIISVTGGDLPGTYRFQSFHLHWGPNHNSGSEHQVNGDKSVGECHFVYSHTETGQRAVLGFLMETKIPAVHQRSDSRDPVMQKQWQNYFDVAHLLNVTGSSTTIDLTLSVLMGGNLTDFWRYSGSLTTPPCTENVIWTVFKQRIFILDYDFEYFRDDIFFESYRGPQPLYNRQVYRSFADEDKSPIPDEKLCLPTPKSEAPLFFNIFHKTTVFLLLASFLTSDQIMYSK